MSSYNFSGARHWSEHVNEAVVVRGPNGSFNICIEGGSEYGQFVVIGDVLKERVRFKLNSVSAGEIILEINGKHVAGYTQSDAISLIKESNEHLEVVTVYPGKSSLFSIVQALSAVNLKCLLPIATRPYHLFQCCFYGQL